MLSPAKRFCGRLEICLCVEERRNGSNTGCVNLYITSIYFLFILALEIRSIYVALAILKFTMQNRMASNSKSSTCFLNAGIRAYATMPSNFICFETILVWRCN